MNAEPLEQIPSFVVAQIGSRRIALQSSGIAELILSPQLHTFPHTTSLIVGVVLRRGRVLPHGHGTRPFRRPIHLREILFGD